ncbi:hypothetical protein B0H10DRAFT_334850 [Mycena sp. CBHHK59/15]|nr:hypothetical protein B0H10DRAFT_334850 [Mycena sp. CBHHK59/15]
MQRYSKFLLTTHALRGLAYQSRKLHGTPDKSLALTVLITLNLSRWFLGWLTIYTPDTYLCKSSEPAGASDTHPRKSAARFHPPLRRQAESSPHLRNLLPHLHPDSLLLLRLGQMDLQKLLPSRQFLSRRHLCRVGPQAPAPCPRRRLSLAYLNGSEVLLLFEADAKYYLLDLNNDRLLHFGAKFASHDDFLSRWDACPHDVQYLPDMDRECAEMMGKRRPALDPLEQSKRGVGNMALV